MHICIISVIGISKKTSNWGGVATHLKNLIKLLLHKGHEITLITSEGEETSDSNLTVLPILKTAKGWKYQSWINKAEKFLISLHKKTPVDCVFSEGVASSSIAKFLNQNGIPLVSFMHNLSTRYFHNKWQEVDSFRSLKSYLFRSIPTNLYDIFIKDIPYFRKCDLVVTGSTAIASHLKNFYLVPDQKIFIFHNWVYAEKFKRDLVQRNKVRKEFNLKENDIVFLLLGGLWRPKGFRIAFDAFNNLIHNIPNIFLFIAGEGPDRVYLENKIKSIKGLSERVKLLGLYPHDKLPSLFSAADIFIIPSLMDEVLSYTLLEAMSCELPVIASDIAANREALGEKGVFVQRGNVEALTKMMFYFSQNFDSLKLHAAYNRKRLIENFSYEAASEKLEIILKLIGTDK